MYINPPDFTIAPAAERGSHECTADLVFVSGAHFRVEDLPGLRCVVELLEEIVAEQQAANTYDTDERLDAAADKMAGELQDAKQCHE